MADSVLSVHGVPIRLTDERWAHIVENRDEVAELYDEVLSTVASPDAVLEAKKGAVQAMKGGIMGKTMVVVYREVSRRDGFIITAWLTNKPERTMRRRAVWTRAQ